MSRWFLTLALVSCWLFKFGYAHAWVTTTIKGDQATLDVQPDGSAVVEHEILIRVRGGPLKEFTFTGVDTDAEPVGTANIVRAKSGLAAGHPIALIWEREGEHLHLEVGSKRGVRAGHFLVKFSYTTDLGASGAIQREGDGLELSWRGLVFADGIDSLSTQFVLPRGKTPPRLPSVEEEQDVSLVAAEEGVFLSSLVREAERDVLTVTRPHVAKQERVLWRILVAGDLLPPATRSEASALPVFSAADSAQITEAPRRLPGKMLVLSLVLGFAFCCLVSIKRLLLSRGISRLALGKMPAGKVRFMVGLPYALRMPVLFVLTAGAAYLGLVMDWATLAALLWGAAIVFAVQLPSPPVQRARGPGRWQAVDAEKELWQKRTANMGWARLLDAGTFPGFLLFCLASGALVVFALRLLGSLPYYSAMLFAACSGLIPVFFTLGSSELAEPLTVLQRRLLRGVAERLEKQGVVYELVARYPEGEQHPDEYRLSIPVSRAQPGLHSLEVAAEFNQGLLLVLPFPVLLVKVQEQSPASVCLPMSAEWSRGSSKEERVAVIRPRLPNLKLFTDLLWQLRTELRSSPKRPASGPKSKTTKQRGPNRSRRATRPLAAPSRGHAA